MSARDDAPKTGVIAEFKEWEKLWKSWRGSESVPYVEFREAIVIVAVNSDPNRIGVEASVTKEGALMVAKRSEMLGFESPTTCGYQLALISRHGVKTVKGQAIGKE